ncbi:hypothetical protein ACA910_021887 [Epithemia clementina (nom. ined.)]
MANKCIAVLLSITIALGKSPLHLLVGRQGALSSTLFAVVQGLSPAHYSFEVTTRFRPPGTSQRRNVGPASAYGDTRLFGSTVEEEDDDDDGVQGVMQGRTSGISDSWYAPTTSDIPKGVLRDEEHVGDLDNDDSDDDDNVGWESGAHVNGKDSEERLEKKWSTDDKEEDGESEMKSIQAQLKSLNEKLEKHQFYFDRIFPLLKQQLKVSSTTAAQTASATAAPVTETTTEEKQGVAQFDPFQTITIPTTSSSPQEQWRRKMVPLKAMLFIDGTWLYYSIFGRDVGRCPIRQKFGMGWANQYDFDFGSLPRIICQALRDPGWSSSAPVNDEPGPQSKQRPLEIVRACVFTSLKPDTSTSTLRFQMLKDLEEANYDVHTMETVGKSEKCVDIQLAVEMLHYATVPDAFDIAIILTGDKDFLPAMARTRQKGRRVALVSMRDGCNRALKVTNGIKDFDIVWLEDHIDKLVVPKSGVRSYATISLLTFEIILKDFIKASGLEMVNSRDVGRYLQGISIGNTDLSSALRFLYGGLSIFLAHSSVFETEDDFGGKNLAYWVKLVPYAEQIIVESSKKVEFSADEEEFFETYDARNLMEDYKTAYYYTLLGLEEFSDINPSSSAPTTAFPMGTVVTTSAALSTTSTTEKDLSAYTVAQLKELCRERDLPTTGLKAQLVQRVMEDVEKEKQLSRLKQPAASHAQAPQHFPSPVPPKPAVDPKVESYLQGIVKEYLRARGGQASSRDIGRYLVANKASDVRHNTASVELKVHYNNLSFFISCYPDVFSNEGNIFDDEQGPMGFLVKLK